MTSCSPPGLYQSLVEQMDDVIGYSVIITALGAVIVQCGVEAPDPDDSGIQFPGVDEAGYQ